MGARKAPGPIELANGPGCLFLHAAGKHRGARATPSRPAPGGAVASCARPPGTGAASPRAGRLETLQPVGPPGKWPGARMKSAHGRPVVRESLAIIGLWQSARGGPRPSAKRWACLAAPQAYTESAYKHFRARPGAPGRERRWSDSPWALPSRASNLGQRSAKNRGRCQ